MNNTFIDLHLHSYYSDDGEFSPSELMKRCQNRGIRIVAIADHNSIRAIEEAKKEANKYRADEEMPCPWYYDCCNCGS